MTQVWERLFLGSLADAEDLAGANTCRISTVISLCEGCVAIKRSGVRYHHIPIEDAKPVSRRKFDAIINAIAENIRRGTVLVNCLAGLSRAPCLTAAYMHVVGYRSIDSALAEIKRLRSYTNPSDILLESIRRHLK